MALPGRRVAPARAAGALLVALAAALLAACGSSEPVEDSRASQPAAAASASGGDTLREVRERGRVIVGVNDALPGFGYIRPDGTFSGFDVEFGHALAAAIFGDRDAVHFVGVSASSRFEALRAREVDVLFRNTTWTVSRDTQEMTFAVPNFYDGQGVMVRAADRIDSLEDLDGAVVCVLSGTTNQLNQDDTFAGTDVTYQALGFDRAETLQEAFAAGRCDAWTADRSQLAARRAAYPERAGGPESLVILTETLSKEPLAPVTRSDDAGWSDLVNWVILGMIAAEELGVTSENVAALAEDPPGQEVARLLGSSVDSTPFEAIPGLRPGFMRDVVEQVGNYGEVYARHIAPLGIEREGSLNALWTQGGLMYAPPFR